MTGPLVWTHDLEGNRTGVIGRDFLEFFIEEELDGEHRLVIEIPADHPKAYLLLVDSELTYGGARFHIADKVEQRLDNRVTVRVEAVAAWYRLGENDFAGSIKLDDINPALGLAQILADTQWVVDPSTVVTGEFSMEQQDRTHLELIRTWAKVTGTFVRWDTMGRQVALVPTRGAQLGLAFRKGRNLRNLVRRTSPPKVTRLIPRGAEDITIESVNIVPGSEAIEDLSYYTDLGIGFDVARERYTRTKVWRDTSFVTPRDLYAAARVRIAREAQSIERVDMDVVDISSITGLSEDLAVGDTVAAHDPDFDEDFTATVVRRKTHPLKPARNEVTLSAYDEPLSEPNNPPPARSSISQQWVQLMGPVTAESIRSDTPGDVAEISVEFIAAAKANFHVDLWMVGVGDGTAYVSVIDAEAADTVQYRPIEVPYTDGATVRAQVEWALAETASGLYTYRVQVTTVADGGPSASLGVDVLGDTTDRTEAGFWILAKGAAAASPSTLYPSEYELIVIELLDPVWYAPMKSLPKIIRDTYEDTILNEEQGVVWYAPAASISS